MTDILQNQLKFDGTASLPILRQPSALFFEIDGEYRPSWVVDLTGRVIFCCKRGSENALVPYGRCIVCSDVHTTSPLLWHPNVTTFLQDVEQYASLSSELNLILSTCYPRKQIQSIPAIFVAEPLNTYKDEHILEAIKAYNGSSADNEKATIASNLASAGVVPIPAITQFNKKYHTTHKGALLTGAIGIVQPGWMNFCQVFEPSVVTHQTK
ncbi:MAG: hypothetical protein V3T17_09795 [Pseudomonadales bacterium]